MVYADPAQGGPTPTDSAPDGGAFAAPAPARIRRPLLFPPLGIGAWVSLPVLTVLGFYRPKFDQIPGLGSGSFVMNFVWLGLATLVALVWIFSARRGRIPRQAVGIITAFSAFFAYCLLSLFWNPDPAAYGLQKNIFAIAVFLASTLCMIGIVTQGRIGAERFFRFLILYGLLWTAVIVVFGGPFSSRFGITVTSDYQMSARIIALGLSTMMAGFIAYTGGPRRIVGAVLVGLVMLSALMATGGRTGLAAAVLVTGVLIFGRLVDALRRGRAPVVVLLFAMAVTLGGAAYLVNISLNPQDVPATLGRFLWILNEDRLQEFNRLQRLVEFPQIFAESPLIGHGSGSWEILEGKEIYYPHNIVIEVLAELGVIGAILLGIAFAVALGSLRHIPRERIDGGLNACCWAYLLVGLAHSMSVGDFSFNFGLYSGLVLMALRPVFLLRDAPARPTEVSRVDHNT